MLNKKSVSIENHREIFRKELERDYPLHEIEALALDNEKKRREIALLDKQLKSYPLTRLVAWSGFIITMGTVIYKLLLLLKWIK